MAKLGPKIFKLGLEKAKLEPKMAKLGFNTGKLGSKMAELGSKMKLHFNCKDESA